jgi:hypothetical protein
MPLPMSHKFPALNAPLRTKLVILISKLCTPQDQKSWLIRDDLLYLP